MSSSSPAIMGMKARGRGPEGVGVFVGVFVAVVVGVAVFVGVFVAVAEPVGVAV